jgi:curved DNA-binding protein CbpA/tetratricopeptide (TPR) repeat protein
MKTYYDVLGVPYRADEEAIRAALRKAAKELHPDVNVRNAEAEQQLKRVIAAYKVLRNPQQRAAYDRALRLRRSRKARRFFATALASAGLCSSIIVTSVVWLTKPQAVPSTQHESITTSTPDGVLRTTGIESGGSAHNKGAVAFNDEPSQPRQTLSPAPKPASAATDGSASSKNTGSDRVPHEGAPGHAVSQKAALAAEWEQLAQRGEPRAILAFAARNPGAPEAELARSWLALLIAASDDIPLLEALHAGGHETVAELAQQRLKRLVAVATAEPDTAAAAIAKGPEEAEAAIAKSPEKADATKGPEFYLARGELRSKGADFDGAIADFDAAIRIDPQNASAFSRRANAWGAKGDFQRALADFEAAISLDATNAAIFRDRGILWRRSGAPDRALVDFDQAIRLGFSDAAAYDARGQIWLEKGHYERAIADFSQAVKVDPNFAPAYAHRAIALRGKGEVDRALADLHHAIRLDPSLSLAKYDNAAGDRHGN